MIDQKTKDEIDALTHEDMCRLWRFAEPGHKYFISGSLEYDYFKEKFKQYGGMTPEISKKIGW